VVIDEASGYEVLVSVRGVTFRGCVFFVMTGFFLKQVYGYRMEHLDSDSPLRVIFYQRKKPE